MHNNYIDNKVITWIKKIKMKKYKIISFILLGITISFFLQDLLPKKSFASNVSGHEIYTPREDSLPNFIKASERAIQRLFILNPNMLVMRSMDTMTLFMEEDISINPWKI